MGEGDGCTVGIGVCLGAFVKLFAGGTVNGVDTISTKSSFSPSTNNSFVPSSLKVLSADTSPAMTAYVPGGSNPVSSASRILKMYCPPSGNKNVRRSTVPAISEPSTSAYRESVL